ncbi:MAG: hypothetical protein KGH60_00035 [Candidatus Micrarchaeota archaeon]|nr:hypothetical protein [Candidatus Micrarchaeota archaeon]
MPEQSNLIRRLVFRLVRRHIAGPTSSSVLAAVRELNDQGLHATVTLLNDHVDDQMKARYNTNAYIQLMKQISRLRLNSDVSLRPTQIGYSLGGDTARKNLESVAEAASQNQLKLWIESEESISLHQMLSLYSTAREASKGGTVGIEIPPTYDEYDIGKMIVPNMGPKSQIKIGRRHSAEPSEKKQEKERKNDEKLVANQYKSAIDRLIKAKAQVTMLDNDYHIVKRVLKMNKEYRKKLSLEMPLGYSGKKLGKLSRQKMSVGVYVPYGKDWVPYFINRLAEGRIRNIAITLLNGEKAGVEEDAK